MENKIIDPFTEKPPVARPDEQESSEMERYNKKRTPHEEGEWVYSQEHGIVWKSTAGDLMGGTPTPPGNPPPPILSDMVKLGNTIDMDAIKPNSVMVIKISPKNPYQAAGLQKGIIEMVLTPRAETLKDKKLTVLFMATEDSIELISPEEMEDAGWVKKDKPLIINPFK